MTDNPSLTIQRDLDDIKLQVKKELDTIRDLMDSLGYRATGPTWNSPYQLHRLRRALRIHYLAMKIRNSAPDSPGAYQLTWDIPPDYELP